MSISKEHYGVLKDGRSVDLYTLKNQNGLEIGIINYGGIVVSCLVPDKSGNLTDVTLGCGHLSDYETQTSNFGALIGRHANRIQNAEFTLGGVNYPLYKNDGENHLHGGKTGFDKKLWDASVIDEKLHLSYISVDKEEGYPGNLSVNVVYSLDDDNRLAIEYKAETDKTTVCNLTNHSYFNLDGHDAGLVTGQKLQIFAEYFTPSNEQLLPDGTIAKVENTPMDFRTLKAIGEDLYSEYSQIKNGGGFDSNWAVSRYDGTLQKAAYAISEKSGITMTTYTTLPGIQFYSGNFLSGDTPGKNNAVYEKRSGFCLETQYFPNALNYKHFVQPILNPGETYDHVTVYQFGVLQ